MAEGVSPRPAACTVVRSAFAIRARHPCVQTHPYDVGDIIVFNDAWHRVEEITLPATVLLRTADSAKIWCAGTRGVAARIQQRWCRTACMKRACLSRAGPGSCRLPPTPPTQVPQQPSGEHAHPEHDHVAAAGALSAAEVSAAACSGTSAYHAARWSLCSAVAALPVEASCPPPAATCPHKQPGLSLLGAAYQRAPWDRAHCQLLPDLAVQAELTTFVVDADTPAT